MRNIYFKIPAGLFLIAVLATQFSCGVYDTVRLERNRTLWRESKIMNYKMTIKISKTGHATPNGKFVITVRNGVAESIKMFDKPDVDMLQNSVIQFGSYDTIEDIFNFISRTDSTASFDRKEIVYDLKIGYPKKVDLDQSGVFDDELYFEVLEFEVIGQFQ